MLTNWIETLKYFARLNTKEAPSPTDSSKIDQSAACSPVANKSAVSTSEHESLSTKVSKILFVFLFYGAPERQWIIKEKKEKST